MDELRKAAQAFADSIDGYENDLPLSAIRAKGALRAALANKPAPQDQDAKDAARYRWLRDNEDFGFTDSSVDYAMKEQKP